MLLMNVRPLSRHACHIKNGGRRTTYDVLCFTKTQLQTTLKFTKWY